MLAPQPAAEMVSSEGLRLASSGPGVSVARGIGELRDTMLR